MAFNIKNLINIPFQTVSLRNYEFHAEWLATVVMNLTLRWYLVQILVRYQLF